MATQLTLSDLDVQKQFARLRRMMSEGGKLHEEQRKLDAERRKTDRERQLAPWQFLVSGLAAGGGLVLATLAVATFWLGLH